MRSLWNSSPRWSLDGQSDIGPIAPDYSVAVIQQANAIFDVRLSFRAASSVAPLRHPRAISYATIAETEEV